MRVTIRARGLSVQAVPTHSATAAPLRDGLSIDAAGAVWGDEGYFSHPLEAAPEKQRRVVEVGKTAFRPRGAFHLFCYATPARRPGELRPASLGNLLIRHVEPDVTGCVGSRSGARTTPDRAE